MVAMLMMSLGLCGISNFFLLYLKHVSVGSNIVLYTVSYSVFPIPIFLAVLLHNLNLPTVSAIYSIQAQA